MTEDTIKLRENTLKSDEWKLTSWRKCECGSVAFQSAFEVVEEATYQAKCTTHYRCLRCGREQLDWERDWS